MILIGITKGPRNRGKEKEVETEKEEGDDREIKQVQFESVAQEHQERQRSLSPIVNLSPDVIEIH